MPRAVLQGIRWPFGQFRNYEMTERRAGRSFTRNDQPTNLSERPYVPPGHVAADQRCGLTASGVWYVVSRRLSVNGQSDRQQSANTGDSRRPMLAGSTARLGVFMFLSKKKKNRGPRASREQPRPPLSPNASEYNTGQRRPPLMGMCLKGEELPTLEMPVHCVPNRFCLAPNDPPTIL